MGLSLLYSAINTKLNKYPEAVHIIAGDLNHVDLKAVFPKFHQHVTCATRGEIILDIVYSNIKQGYRAIPTSHLGQSDHISLFMLPAHIPLRKSEPPTSKTVKIWPVGATSQLQDCLTTQTGASLNPRTCSKLHLYSVTSNTAQILSPHWQMHPVSKTIKNQSKTLDDKWG